MASFNQSPLGQTSVGIGTTNLVSIGSSANNATTVNSTVVFLTDASGDGETIYPKIINVIPSWRRSTKTINSLN
jgi:hypothetical protein